MRKIMEIKFLSSVILMCTLTIATAPPPPGSSTPISRSSATPRKFRDSKISRIQPYVHSETLTAPAVDTYNNFHSEKDSAIKYYHANKFLEKNHGHKKFGVDKKKVSSNHELFKSLGLAKIKTPPGHHRKRLAVESSRHHSRPDDSHMFIIKLPPNPYYYNQNTAQSQNGIEDKNQKISSMGFKSNGKPGRIYHWNLPVLKKMLTKGESTGRKSSNLRHSDDVNDLIDIKNIPTWSNPWDDNNETLDKAFSGKQHRGVNNADINGSNTVHINGIDDDLNLKLLKKKSPTYYAPSKQKKKATVHSDSVAVAKSSSSAASSASSKYFPGNGKPKSFYVIKKNDHKPYYQKLIP
ncbi:uncharacterized protein LOC129574154 isoform X2 [Sitodiplosis mosellana]|uniref:uncharacterized protein LOC129574154 isoform X2 n=1 Tax=Sitodiplosis mosellana TaxID=263140 RepID=UPI0024451EBE|nr:uncharacterized protein LOC129574154 isoform X2 [Sitodiplosis mosellana]